MEFLAHLFDSSGFPARWQCGSGWVDTPWLGWLHILSDLGVWSAYVAIPCVLAYFVLRRKDIPFRTIFLLFGAFILACGTTHLMEAIIFWWPAYRLAGVIKLLTALVSWATVVALVPIVPKVLVMRSPEELEREIVARNDAEIALQQANAELERQVEALRRSNELFRLLVENATDYALIVLSPTGKVVSWNASAERIEGYRADEIIGKHFSCFYPKAAIDNGLPEQELQRALVEGRFEDEGWRVRKNSSQFWANVVIAVLRNASGEMEGFSKITRDLTERKRVEEEIRNMNRDLEDRVRERTAKLQEAEERTRSIVDHVIDGIITIDEEGTVESYNPAAEKIFGYSAPEVVGQNIKALMPEPFHREHDGYLANYLRTGEAKIIGIGREVVGRRKDGSKFAMDLAVSAFHLGQRRHFTGIVRDITERKRAETELREAEERMRSIVDHVINGIITIDEQGMIESYNFAAEKIFGYSVPEVVGQNIKALMPEPFHREHDGYLANYLRTGEAKIIGIGREVVGRRKDGSTFPMDLAVSAFHLGQRRHFTGIVRDITQRKQAEERDRQRTAELNETNRELSQKNQENEMFVYSVSHDLRSPLVNLQGFSKEMDKGCQALQAILADDRLPVETRDQAQSLLADKMAKSLGFIQTAVLRLSSIIDALLRLSRAGRVDYRWQSVDANQVVLQIVASLHGTIAEKKATVQKSELPTVWGDPTAVEQVFANLIGNALNYLDPKRPGIIEIGCRKSSEDDPSRGFVTFYVKDNGLGIPAANQQKIFQLFQRVHPGAAKGEGIGLAIVGRVVERHRGRVWVESQAGVGSTFFVSLPAPSQG